MGSRWHLNKRHRDGGTALVSNTPFGWGASSKEKEPSLSLLLAVTASSGVKLVKLGARLCSVGFEDFLNFFCASRIREEVEMKSEGTIEEGVENLGISDMELSEGPDEPPGLSRIEVSAQVHRPLG